MSHFRIRERSVRVPLFIAAVAAALIVAPATALAASPVILTVGQTDGHLTATWYLPPGVEAKVVEAAQNPATGSDGYFFFENVLAAGSFNTLTDGQTSWTDGFRNDPGTYYIHIAGLDRPCYYGSTCPVREFSRMMTVTIPSAPPVVLPPVVLPPVVQPAPPLVQPAPPLVQPAPPVVQPVAPVVQPVRQPPDCVVPNVTGLRLRASLTKIRQGHCSVGLVRRAYSTRVRLGRVIKQTPRRGRALGNGAEVDLVVSRGPRR